MMTPYNLPIPTLMILMESTLPNGSPVGPVAEQAIIGGVNAIQLRDHTVFPDDLERVAKDLAFIVRNKAALIINDNFEIACHLRLTGIHLPEAAFDPDRSLLTFPMLIGRSVHSVETAKRAEANGANYVVAGNVYETNSHPGKDGQGLTFLKAVCESVSIPVLAIGGITPENTADCIANGASGVVIRSGIVYADDPGEMAHQYRQSLDNAWSVYHHED